jgi:hypothetical protein
MAADAEAEFFEKTRAALALIKLRDPRRLARMQRQMPRILLVPQGGEFFDPGVRTYVMDRQVMRSRSPEEVALAIVHESTHARLRRLSLRPYPGDPARIEALCVREEVAFAELLPDADRLVEYARDKLQRPWWGEQQRTERYEHYMTGIGVPKWIVSIRRRLLKSSS